MEPVHSETYISYGFGPYKVDVSKRLLSRGDASLALQPKTFDLLLLLVSGHGRVFTKKELISALWPGTFVEDASLTFQIAALRKVLGEDGTEWIETLPRYGYRFKGDISEAHVDVVSQSDISSVSADLRAGGPEPSGETKETRSTPIVQHLPPAGVSRTFLYYGLLALLVVVSVLLLMTRDHQSTREDYLVRFSVSPPNEVQVSDLGSISVSPNGEQLIFIGVDPGGMRQLWMRHLTSLTAERIRGTELVDGAFWSPDGLLIGYFSAGKLKTVDVRSGISKTVCDTPPGPSSGTWNKDGVILFHTTRTSEIYRISAAGGTPKRWKGLDTSRHETRHSNPYFLPDGHHFIYFAQSEQAANTGIYVSDLDTNGIKLLVNSNTNAVPTQVRGSSYLLFTRGTDLVAQLFDLEKLDLVGAPSIVAQHVTIEPFAGATPALVFGSANGVLAYRTAINNGSSEIIWFDRAGKRLGAVGALGHYFNLSLSPDETKLLVAKTDAQVGTRDIWLINLLTGAASPFTFGSADEVSALWSPDGRRVAFNAFHEGVTDIYEKPIAGTSGPKLLLHSEESKPIRSWSPDGRYLLFEIGSNTFALPMDAAGEPIGPYAMERAVLSPNGKWAAYTSGQSGRYEVYVQSFPNSDAKWKISTNGGTEPSWRKDGQELFYMSGSDLVGVDVKTESSAFEWGVPKTLFRVNLESFGVQRRYQVAANGRRFLINVPVITATSPPLTVVVNWPGAVNDRTH